MIKRFLLVSFLVALLGLLVVVTFALASVKDNTNRELKDYQIAKYYYLVGIPYRDGTVYCIKYMQYTNRNENSGLSCDFNRYSREYGVR